MARSTHRAAQLPRGQVQRIHHVEMYVANIHRAVDFYRTVLGLQSVGGPVESDSPDRTSMVMERGDIRLVLTAPLSGEGEVAAHLDAHGEGVKDIALAVDDVDALYDAAVGWGARAVREPAPASVGGPAARSACVGVSGDLVHTLIQIGPNDESPAAVPGREEACPDTALQTIDHVALAVAAGEMDRWIDFYVSALRMELTHQEQVNTEYSAMRSKVVTSPNGTVRFPIMEPAPGKRQSQIETFVRSHQGAGAQHLAFGSTDIVRSVTAMRAGVEFLATPATYYDELERRVGDLSAERDALQQLGILVDRDANGLLLQLFSKPVGSRPTLFLEVVERRGAQGFGSGNIKALFEAVERSTAAKTIAAV